MNVILIVDDEPEILDVISVYLTAESFVVHFAENAGAAIEILKQTHVDLIVSDILMPKFGFPYLENFLAENEQRTPILLISSDHDSAKQAYGQKYQILAKPFSFESMLHTIHLLLGH